MSKFRDYIVAVSATRTTDYDILIRARTEQEAVSKAEKIIDRSGVEKMEIVDETTHEIVARYARAK